MVLRMIKKVVFVLVVSSIAVDGKAIRNDDKDKVGCVVCHPLDENKINIHLIPHSHDDVGWLKTVDEYFYGLNTEAVGRTISVHNIISSVVQELLRNPDRRFIQVETSFFYKWWQEQDEYMRSSFKYLVDNGQIEIASAGWAMNDEACTNYQSTIDQFTLGLRKIEETVGKCGRPVVGWQIDPFGHSREHASILVQLGYSALFFARLDREDFKKRCSEHNLDFVWKSSDSLDDSNIFGSIFPDYSYNNPTNFCWDIACGDDQIVDNPDSVLYNINQKVEEFTTVLDKYASYYDKNIKNILVTMGGDFLYQSAGFNYENMDKLIRGFKNHTKYNLVYSTPSCYMKAVHDTNPSLQLKTDDFFPYSDYPHAFWGGYFTSRPNIKRFERAGHNILQATKQLYAFNKDRIDDRQIYDLKYAMGILQHHDAITGTERQTVTDDYVRILTAAIRKAEDPVGEIVSNLLNAKNNVKLDLSSCLLTNFSICSTSQNNDRFVVAVYNPLAWKTTHYLRLPVEGGQYLVNGPDGQEPYDVIESLSTFDFVDIKGEKPSSHELIFAAKDVPAMGLKLYHIEKISSTSTNSRETNKQLSGVFEIDENSNLLKRVTLNNITLDVNQNFYFYKSASDFDSSSGAYLFRPASSTPTPFSPAHLMRVFTGNLVEEIHQKWENENADIYQSIRYYKNENYLEFNWLVGNINIYNSNMGKEVISRFEISNFDNKNIFYTDSNGRQMMKRIKDERFDYKYNVTEEPIASNYYPVTSKIVMKDEEKNIQVTLLNDRSQGGSSLDKNQFELMVHRRLTMDDERGVGEILDESEFSLSIGMYARGSHYLMVGKTQGANENGKTTSAEERIFAHKTLLQPFVGLSPTDMTFEELEKQIDFQYSALQAELPENINILSFEQWVDNSYLLRLEHILEKEEDPKLSKEVTVNIKNLFKNIAISEITETTLGANVPLSEFSKTPRFEWNTLPKITSQSSTSNKLIGEDGSVTLNPMEIRTFIIS
ncbi:lysosomal alpha-mannosidase-like [Diorhabda sublineata]|uniref:lysosomal alpha-mannosidase-like n=1 Tax=Diorhabda sublineata TaxID=1163346 RepID=UPI0024E0F4B4|nr:lysosomal alpha-mannosidase-like [Diorhabda sublineata]